MYLDTLYLMDSLKNYLSPKSKLTTMIKSGEIIKIRRGLYINDEKSDKKTLANMIYGPSYISFEYALSWYGMIPERVETVTSAVYNKNKDKKFDTPVGRFVYQYINSDIYYYGIVRYDNNDDPFLIATREKALCDTLYKIKKIGSEVAIEKLLFEDLRIDENEFCSLNKKDISFLAPLYKRRIVRELAKYIERR